jgi:hypothetical protein
VVFFARPGPPPPPWSAETWVHERICIVIAFIVFHRDKDAHALLSFCYHSTSPFQGTRKKKRPFQSSVTDWTVPALYIFYRFDRTNWTVEWQTGIKREVSVLSSYRQALIAEGSKFAFGAILHSPHPGTFFGVSLRQWFGEECELLH